ncbi:MAG: hypothetical protein KF799_10405 [Bdellovibrionales bacterium]|nr:hypothetical protein [Bdellovibrionales bacterium]
MRALATDAKHFQVALKHCASYLNSLSELPTPHPKVWEPFKSITLRYRPYFPHQAERPVSPLERDFFGLRTGTHFVKRDLRFRLNSMSRPYVILETWSGQNALLGMREANLSDAYFGVLSLKRAAEYYLRYTNRERSAEFLSDMRAVLNTDLRYVYVLGGVGNQRLAYMFHVYPVGSEFVAAPFVDLVLLRDCKYRDESRVPLHPSMYALHWPAQCVTPIGVLTPGGL